MNTVLWIENIAAHWMQATILVAAGVALPALFALRAPRTMLPYWQALLAACLLLPFTQPWLPHAAPRSVMGAVQSTGADEVIFDGVSVLALTDIALAVIAAGIVLRFVWFCLGLWNLHLYRRQAVPLEARLLVASPSRMGLRPRSAVFLSKQVRGPVTFGFLRPMVLLPNGFSALPHEQQRAILQHEFLHVERGDWLFTLLEELCRAMFWFHPAVWWLVARIRLVREQVVDQATIDLTRDRVSYVEALLAIARTPQQGAFAGAPLFLSTRHLHARVARIAKEDVMSHRKLAFLLSTVSVCVLSAASLAVWSFPLDAGPQGDEARRVSNQEARSHRVELVRPMYPRDARRDRIEGTVKLEIQINKKGEVADARVLSGPTELRKVSLEAVLQWKYATDWDLPVTAPVDVNFTLSK